MCPMDPRSRNCMMCMESICPKMGIFSSGFMGAIGKVWANFLVRKSSIVLLIYRNHICSFRREQKRIGRDGLPFIPARDQNYSRRLLSLSFGSVFFTSLCILFLFSSECHLSVLPRGPKVYLKNQTLDFI